LGNSNDSSCGIESHTGSDLPILPKEMCVVEGDSIWKSVACDIKCIDNCHSPTDAASCYSNFTSDTQDKRIVADSRSCFEFSANQRDNIFGLELTID
jgi:hypothetical protein